MRKGKYEIFKDKKSEYRFRLRSPNGRIVAASEGYTNLSGCKRGIKAVKRLADSEIVRIY
jgi:uncharacterized protein YegP (UPF0339 family)